jgi:hypothetical protein
MSSKKFDWITVKEVAGGFIRFAVMAGLGCHIIKSQAKLYTLIEAIYIGKIVDWRVILVMQGAIMVEMIVLIIAYMRLGIKTTDAHATKLSAQLKIAGNEISGQYESAKKD